LKEEIIMNVFKCRPTAELPTYGTSGSACFDVKACLESPYGERIKAYDAWNKEVPFVVKNGKIKIQPMQRVLIPTGLIFDIPDGYCIEMYIRSSVATKKGLHLVNGVGIIDSDYVEETHIIVMNVSDSLVTVEHGERLAQCRLTAVVTSEFAEITEKPVQKTDRDGGIGSTGV
jgi:dUTP pyrophosphatase